MVRKLVVTVTLSLAGCLVPLSAAAQGSISQARALNGGVTPGDAPGFPITLSLSGTYKLTSNLVVPNACGRHAIVMTARWVTLDLNGFFIIGPNSNCSDGIVSDGSVARVINGTVRGFRNGLSLTPNAYTGQRVESVRAESNTASGIVVGHNSMVTDSIVESNGGTGLSAGSGSLLHRNTVAGNQRGIVVARQSSVMNNNVRQNSAIGVEMENDTVGWGNNVLSHNGSGGPQFTGGTSLGVNLCDGASCQ
jgi:hypothetical protein